jgi:hypothetical protein
MFRLGLGTEFCYEKIPRNKLGTVSIIPWKKMLIPRHCKFRGRANFEAQNGIELREEKKVLQNSRNKNRGFNFYFIYVLYSTLFICQP